MLSESSDPNPSSIPSCDSTSDKLVAGDSVERNSNHEISSSPAESLDVSSSDSLDLFGNEKLEASPELLIQASQAIQTTASSNLKLNDLVSIGKPVPSTLPVSDHVLSNASDDSSQKSSSVIDTDSNTNVFDNVISTVEVNDSPMSQRIMVDNSDLKGNTLLEIISDATESSVECISEPPDVKVHQTVPIKQYACSTNSDMETNTIDEPIITSQSTSGSCDKVVVNLAVPAQYSVEQRTQNSTKKLSEYPLFVKAITIEGQSDNAETLNVIQQYVPESCNTRLSIKCSNSQETPTISKARIINRSSKANPPTSKPSASTKGVISKTEKEHLRE